MMNKIIFVIIGMLVIVPTVRAVSVELLENTDQCIFKNGIDHCFSKYLLCSNTTIKTQDIKFVFRDMEREYITKDELGDKLDYEFETEKKEDCYEVSITGWKNPYMNIDNILCYGDVCFYKYAWWNTSYDNKIPFYCYCPHCASDTEMMLLASNSTYNMGAYISGSLELFWVNITNVNSTWRICALMYFNDSTDYVMVDATETYRIEMFIDEGNSTDYGTPETSLFAWWHMNNTEDSSIYGNDLTNNGADSSIAKIGKGFDFESVDNDFMTTGTIDAIFTNGFTFTLWMKWETEELGYIVDMRNATTSPGYVLWSPADHMANAQLFTSTGSPEPKCVFPSPTSWNHYALIHNGTHANAYLNGVLCASVSDAGTVTALTDNIELSREWGGSPFNFDGLMDEVRIYNRSLSADEIMMLYNNTIGTHNVTQFGFIILQFPPPPPIIPPLPIHSFIVFKIINPEIPFIGELLERLIFKGIIFFMDRLTVIGNVIIGGNLDVGGNVTAENVFIPSYVFAHTNTIIAVASAGTWYNVPFDEEPSGPKSRITHTHNDNTNDTFTIQDNGTYNIHYAMSFSDATPSPTSHIVMRVVKNGMEIKGSLLEEDSTKQYSDFTISNGPIVYLVTGDEIKFQFASDDTDVSLTSHRTYGDHHDLGVVKIIRIA